MKLLFPLLLALSLVACKKDPAPTTPPPDNGGGGGDPEPTDTAACEVSDDCVAVELQCCDACNGGEAVAVHKDHADAVAADSPRGRGECGDIACTEMACPAWVASCEDGKCTIARGEFE
jgi:hypothetical protein